MAPMRCTFYAVFAGCNRADQVIEYLFQLALMERDAQKAQQAVTRIVSNGLVKRTFRYPTRSAKE